MSTPAKSALAGLVEALRRVADIDDNPRAGTDRQRAQQAFAAQRMARAALDAWEHREPLVEDGTLIQVLKRRGLDSFQAASVLRELEAHLLGGPRGAGPNTGETR